MDALIVASRAVHYAAAVALTGELAFFLFIARPVLRKSAQQTTGSALLFRSRALRVCAWSLAIFCASGAAWLVAQAVSMSGTGIVRSLDRETLGAVLTETLFGRVWIVRLALALALGATIVLIGRTSARLEGMAWACALPLACALLGSLAWAGHASAEQGFERLFHLAADVLHLLAAGAWLGALPALAFVLRRARRSADPWELAFAARSTRRFSALGLASVTALVLTGTINAWYTVGSIPAMFGTTYGWLLSTKLVLFAGMVSLAVVNRLRLMPRLTGASADSVLPALERLSRNTVAETVLGLGVLGVVGALGVTIPALHVRTLWPFPFTIDWDADGVSEGARNVALLVPTVALGMALWGLSVRSRALTLSGACALVPAIGVSAWLLAVPAYPTTYFHSPADYATASIARGAPLYSQNCTVCHGKLGHGDGPAAASLPMRPADLTEHLLHHREGELLWWIQHGISGTPMPGFGGLIGEEGLWDLLNYLRAQAEAEEGKAMTPSIEPWRSIVAPDFTFQIGTGEQETLAQQRGRHIVLLVFYTLPDSLARLRSLTRFRGELEHAGIRVIAVPMQEAKGPPPGVDAAMLIDPDPGIVDGYSVFRRIAKEPLPGPLHLEFLIDIQGYLRARWTPGESPGWKSIPDLLLLTNALKREKPHAPALARHTH